MVDLKKIKIPKKLILPLVGVAIVLIGLLLYVRLNANKDASNRKVIYDGQDNSSPQEQLFSIPKGAKSAVCDGLPADKVEVIIGYKTNGALVSIPTTKAGTATVSACMYVVTGADKAKTNIRTVIVTSRVFSSGKSAQASYDRLAKAPSSKAESVATNRMFNQSASQLVTVSGNKLNTITIVRANSKNKVELSVFMKLADLL